MAGGGADGGADAGAVCAASLLLADLRRRASEHLSRRVAEQVGSAVLHSQVILTLRGSPFYVSCRH